MRQTIESVSSLAAEAWAESMLPGGVFPDAERGRAKKYIVFENFADDLIQARIADHFAGTCCFRYQNSYFKPTLAEISDFFLAGATYLMIASSSCSGQVYHLFN